VSGASTTALGSILPVALLGLVACTPGPDAVTRAQLDPLGDDRWLSRIDGAELVLVPGATFAMGSDDGAFDERPAHRVRLGSFLIDRFEVSNARYAAFVQASGLHGDGPWERGAWSDDLPVRFVTWHDAAAYCAWAGRSLPTEAQWELAARGPEARTWPWGDAWCPDCARTGAWIDDGPLPVGSSPGGASAAGAEDLAGNVWEWTADWYDRHYYGSFDPDEVTVEPPGPSDGAPPEPRFVANGTAAGNERSTLKVIRGGGWTSPPDHARGARRMWANPEAWLNDTGFRCAVPLGET